MAPKQGQMADRQVAKGLTMAIRPNCVFVLLIENLCAANVFNRMHFTINIFLNKKMLNFVLLASWLETRAAIDWIYSTQSLYFHSVTWSGI